jgi:lysine/ornithine N-monooxygenase
LRNISFIESLSLKIHPTPLAVSQLMELFQQFYVTAFQNIDTHISHSWLSLSSKKRSSPSTPKNQNPTQMLSISEISQKKKNRKLLEVKRLALEEAVERRITEGVYDRIWRHKSTDDEARDEALRSKMEALNVVGVKLEHLGVELDVTTGNVEEELSPAVDALVAMNRPKFPLGKLTYLKQAHKSIVGLYAGLSYYVDRELCSNVL